MAFHSPKHLSIVVSARMFVALELLVILHRHTVFVLELDGATEFMSIDFTRCENLMSVPFQEVRMGVKR